MTECPDINDWWRNWLTKEERQKFVSGEWKLTGDALPEVK